MPSGRQPRKKGEAQTPEILRAVRVGDHGDVYGPGEEEELVEALTDMVEEHNEQVKARGVGQKLTVNGELKRLHIAGHLVNFKGVTVKEEDLEEDDQDLTANRIHAERAQVTAPGDESTPTAPVRRTRRRGARTTEGIQSNEEITRTDNGTGEGDE